MLRWTSEQGAVDLDLEVDLDQGADCAFHHRICSLAGLIAGLAKNEEIISNILLYIWKNGDIS